MIAMNVVKFTYTNHHFSTSFPAKWRCTVNSYRSVNRITNKTNYTDSFPGCQPFFGISRNTFEFSYHFGFSRKLTMFAEAAKEMRLPFSCPPPGNGFPDSIPRCSLRPVSLKSHSPRESDPLRLP